MPSCCCWKQSSKGAEQHLSKRAAVTCTEPAWFLYLFYLPENGEKKHKVSSLIAQRTFFLLFFSLFLCSLCTDAPEQRVRLTLLRFLPLFLLVWAQFCVFLTFNTSCLILGLVRQIEGGSRAVSQANSCLVEKERKTTPPQAWRRECFFKSHQSLQTSSNALLNFIGVLTSGLWAQILNLYSQPMSYLALRDN